MYIRPQKQQWGKSSHTPNKKLLRQKEVVDTLRSKGGQGCKKKSSRRGGGGGGEDQNHDVQGVRADLERIKHEKPIITGDPTWTCMVLAV